MPVMLTLFIVLNVATIHKAVVVRGQVIEICAIAKQQALQIQKLRKSNTQWRNKYVQSQIQLKNVSMQLKTAQGQISKTTANGTWYKDEGIATAYSPYDNISGIEAGADPNKTSIGIMPGNGIIAVDPNKIPYNSKMLIICSDGTTYSGVAGDTGGALRSDTKNHVDIFKTTYSETQTFGHKAVTILWQPTK
jgi:3D (Asp-Asp-Asp) domain-containing protein